MATNAANILVPQVARLWLAPVGTAAPADVTAVMGAGWFDVGLFTPDSLSWTSEPTFEEVRSHQSAYPTRRFQTEDSANLSVELQEWSAANFKAAYGGGEVTSPSAGLYKFVPPTIGGRTEIACTLEIIDGTKHLRRVVPRALNVEGITQNFSRTAEALLPLSLSVLGGDAVDAWYDLNDIPSFDETP